MVHPGFAHTGELGSKISSTQENPLAGGRFEAGASRVGELYPCDSSTGVLPVLAASQSIISIFFIEGGSGMPKSTVDGVSKQIKALYGAAGIFAAWLGALSFMLYLQYGEVSKIKQDIADHGLGNIVSELQTPKTPDQLRASLATVVAQVETARANGLKANPEKVKTLSKAISKVVQENPDLPEAWRAAAQVISFRAPLGTAPPRACFSGESPKFLPPVPERPQGIAPAESGGTWVLVIPDVSTDCTFDLANAETIAIRDKKMIDEESKRVAPQPVFLALRFIGAHIIYRGTPLPPDVKMYIFENCTFDWSISSEPPMPAQKMTVDLLQADNLGNVKVSGV